MNAVLFLNGHYNKEDIALAVAQISSVENRSVVIAVDGGIDILQKKNIPPDYWVSDLDSSPKIEKGFLTDTECLFYPSEKNKTDAELALDLCLKMGVSHVDIYGWADVSNETDHMLGNLYLSVNRDFAKKLTINYLSSQQVIFLLKSGKRFVTDAKGMRLSILPVGTSATISLTGVRYKAKDLIVKRGQTISLRNEVTAQRAMIETNKPVFVIISR